MPISSACDKRNGPWWLVVAEDDYHGMQWSLEKRQISHYIPPYPLPYPKPLYICFFPAAACWAGLRFR